MNSWAIYGCIDKLILLHTWDVYDCNGWFFSPEYDILSPFTLYSDTSIPSHSSLTIICSLGDPIIVKAEFSNVLVTYFQHLVHS